MINMLMVFLVLIGLIVSIVRTYKYKDVYTTVMTSLVTSFLILVVSYFSYYTYYIHLSEGRILYILLGLFALIGILFGFKKKNRQAILVSSASTTFYIFLVVYVPIFIGKFIFDGYEDKNMLIKILFFLVILSINYFVVYFVYYSGYSNSIYSSETYINQTKQLKESKELKDQKEYQRRLQKSETVDQTFYPLNFYLLFIVSVVFIGVIKFDYDLDVQIDPNDTFFYKEIQLDLHEQEGLYIEDVVIYIDYEAGRDDSNNYDLCVSRVPYQLKECVKTSFGYQQVVYFKEQLYFIVDEVVYIYRLNNLFTIYEIPEETTITDVLLYISDGKLYYESDHEKFEIIDTDFNEIIEYESSFDIGNPSTYYGHLVIKLDNSRSLIDGKEYPIHASRGALYFYEDLITDGEFQLRDRSIHRMFDEKKQLVLIDGHLYQQYLNKNSLLYVNTENEYDVIRIKKNNLGRGYISHSYLKVGEDDMLYLDSYNTQKVTGIKFDYLSNNDVVDFSLIWLLITYVLASGIYFGINKETYRKR